MPHATRPGDVLGDRYRLVDLLTENDGGRFWRAHDRILERHVAIHVIRGDDERAPALMEAARRSAAVHDRRVLRVLDAECTDDECYVVNEWGWGTSLDIVAASGPLGAAPGGLPGRRGGRLRRRRPRRRGRPTAASTPRTSWSTAPAACASSGCASTPPSTGSAAAPPRPSSATSTTSPGSSTARSPPAGPGARARRSPPRRAATAT